MSRLLCAIALLTIVGCGLERSAVAQTSGMFFPLAAAGHQACDPWVDYNCVPPKLSPMAVKAMERNRDCDPYLDYACLDSYLGDNVATRFFRYYQLEWGKAVPPTDPKAPPSSRPESLIPPTPQPSPPMPFTEWPYGGTVNIGKTLPNSVDSPLMVAIANTQLGKAMNDSHVQVYGWVAPGGNISTNTVRPAGNAPIGYDYTPNTVQLDQAVVYVERLPDTVQNTHFDWGFRFSALYGVDYRYTTAYGLFSYQLLNHNFVYGYDFPMVYADSIFRSCRAKGAPSALRAGFNAAQTFHLGIVDCDCWPHGGGHACWTLSGASGKQRHQHAARGGAHEL
jgi:hypothetical protein